MFNKGSRVTLLINGKAQQCFAAQPSELKPPPLLKKTSSKRSKTPASTSKTARSQPLEGKSLDLHVPENLRLYPVVLPPKPKAGQIDMIISGKSGLGLPKAEIQELYKCQEKLYVARACGARECNRLVAQGLVRVDFFDLNIC